jgi:hypothetical protein
VHGSCGQAFLAFSHFSPHSVSPSKRRAISQVERLKLQGLECAHGTHAGGPPVTAGAGLHLTPEASWELPAWPLHLGPWRPHWGGHADVTGVQMTQRSGVSLPGD